MMPRRSPKRAKTAARKASHGGRRAGAGRKREKLPADVIARLGECPEDPNGIRVWNARLLGEVQILSMKGLIGTDLAASLRANAGAIDRALPPAKLQADDEDEDDDEENDGPEPVETPSDGGIRVG